MKSLSFWLCLMLGSVSYAFACSLAPPQPFCETLRLYPDHAVVLANVVGEVERGMELDILQVFRGAESRSRVTLWDGQDFECNGPFPVRASMIAPVGETVLMILFPVQDSNQSEWEQPGDYVTPFLYAHTVSLIKNGRNFEARTWQGVDGERNSLPERELSDLFQTCAPGGWQSITIWGEPAGQELVVEGFADAPVCVHLFNLQGQIVGSYQILPESFPFRINLSELSTGLYLVQFRTEAGWVQRKKVWVNLRN